MRAIRLDPNFAIAYAKLAMSYGNLGETTLAAENTRKAYELRETGERARGLTIEAFYYQLVTGDLEKARRVYEVWAQTYPRDYMPPTNLSILDWAPGRDTKGPDEAREAAVSSRRAVQL